MKLVPAVELSGYTLTPYTSQADGTLDTPVLPASILTFFDTLGTGGPGKCGGPAPFHIPGPVLILNSPGASPSPGQILFECLDRVPIFFTYILLDVFSKYNQWIVILFHTTRRTLYARLEPFRNAFLVEHVFAPELFIGPFGKLETYGARVNRVHLTFSIFDSNPLALFTTRRD